MLFARQSYPCCQRQAARPCQVSALQPDAVRLLTACPSCPQACLPLSWALLPQAHPAPSQPGQSAQCFAGIGCKGRKVQVQTVLPCVPKVIRNGWQTPHWQLQQQTRMVGQHMNAYLAANGSAVGRQLQHHGLVHLQPRVCIHLLQDLQQVGGQLQGGRQRGHLRRGVRPGYGGHPARKPSLHTCSFIQPCAWAKLQSAAVGSMWGLLVENADRMRSSLASTCSHTAWGA
jgi:hypothetical protein